MGNDGRAMRAPTQRPKASRRGGFQPPPKPSPYWGEGGTAHAVTDEGSSVSRLCSSHRICQRGSALRGGFLSERPERNQRDAGDRSRRDHGSTCVPPGSRSPLSPGPPIRGTRALGPAPASGAGGGRHPVPPFVLPPLVCPMGTHTPRWCRACPGRIGSADAKPAGAQSAPLHKGRRHPAGAASAKPAGTRCAPRHKDRRYSVGAASSRPESLPHPEGKVARRSRDG